MYCVFGGGVTYKREHAHTKYIATHISSAQTRGQEALRTVVRYQMTRLINVRLMEASNRNITGHLRDLDGVVSVK